MLEVNESRSLIDLDRKLRERGGGGVKWQPLIGGRSPVLQAEETCQSRLPVADAVTVSRHYARF